MRITRNGKLGIAAVLAVALVSGGAAFAATKLHSSSGATRFGLGGPMRTGYAFPRGGYGFGPGGGGRFRGGFGFSGLGTAAGYLGLTTDQLFEELRTGKTLAQIADAQSGKSASGLIDAMVAAQQKEIEAAVQSGRLTKSQGDELTAELKSRVTDLVEGTFRRGPGDFGAAPPTHI
jgi:hypothetical protein